MLHIYQVVVEKTRGLMRLEATLMAILAVWPFVYFWPATLGQRVFIDKDVFLFFYPIRLELARRLAEGSIPLWNSEMDAGFPLFSEGQIAALYPPNMFLFRLLPIGLALSYSILLHFSWASLGMYLFCRSLGSRVASALLASFVFSFSGFFLAHVQHLSLMATASWLPWLLYLQRQYQFAREENRQTWITWFALTSFAIALQFLSGFPQVSAMNLSVFMVFVMLSTKASESKKILRDLGAALMCIALGLGIAAVQLLPLLELIPLSIRGQPIGEAEFISFSLDPGELIQSVFPFWLSEPSYGNVEYWFYLGVFPFLCACIAPFLCRDRRTWILWLLAILCLALALGSANPLYPWLYDIPVLNRFRVPARFLFLFVFFSSILAATAFDEFQRYRANSSKTQFVAGALVILFVFLTGSEFVFAYAAEKEFWIMLSSYLSWILVFAAVVVVVFGFTRLGANTVYAVVALGLTVFDLAAFAPRLLPSLAATVPTASLAEVPRTVRVMDDTSNMYRIFGHAITPISRNAMSAAVLPDRGLIYGKQYLTTYSPLGLKKNLEFIQAMTPSMLNLANVRYYLVPLQLPPYMQSLEGPTIDTSEPMYGLSPDLLSEQHNITPTRVTGIEMVSYTDKTVDLPTGYPVGELVLRTDEGKLIALPIRMGIETADWSYEAFASSGKVSHGMASERISFPAFLSSVGREFEGQKYIARYPVTSQAPLILNAVAVRSFLPDGGFIAERISLIDDAGRAHSLSSLLGRDDFSLVFRSHTVAMWENRSVMPRAFVVHKAEIVGDDRVLERLQSQDLRLDRIVFLNEGQALDDAIVSLPSPDETMITSYRPERIVIKTKTVERGYLVLADSWYPGWVARVDGKDVPILRADYVFRAVLIEAGKHEVEFEYRPISFYAGAALSAASILLAVFFGMTAFFRAPRPNTTQA